MPLLGQGVSDVVKTRGEELIERGWTEGQIKALLSVLTARGVVVPADARSRIEACSDLDVLDRWIARAARAETIGDVLGDE